MKTLFLGWLLLLSVMALAQDDFYEKDQPSPAKRQQYVVTLRDGTTLVGQLIRQDTVETVIKTVNLGQVSVRADQIVSVVAVRSNRNSGSAKDVRLAVGYPNLFPQYLNLTPTAYPAERGRLYYRNTQVFYNQFDYGINDNWSVGAGLLVFPIISLLSLNTKVSFPVGERVRLGVQGQYVAGAFIFLDVETFRFNYVQAIASVGTPQRNVTFGLGTVFSGGQFADAQILTVGIVRKLNPRLTFISENHVLLGEDIGFNLFPSAGLRFDRRRHSFDLSAKVPFVFGGTFSLTPFASYQLRIGR